MSQQLYRSGYRARVPGDGGVKEAVAGAWSEGLASGVIDAAVGAGIVVTEALAREHVADEKAMIDDVSLRVSRRFAEFRAEYMERRQGRDALTAPADFARAYEDIAREETEGLDMPRNEVFEGEMRRRLAERGLLALRDGLAWRERQRSAWFGSVLDEQAAGYLSYVAENPRDVAGQQVLRRELEASWRRANPGLAGTMPGVDDAALVARAQAMAQAGDAAGIAELLRGGGSLSQRLQAANNFGSVTLGKDVFAAYATPEDGYKAVMERLLRYHTKEGWRAKNIAELIHIYAPEGENDTKGYIRDVAAWTGMDAEAALDFADPKMYAAVTSAILRKEHGLRVDAAALLPVAEDFLANGGPRPVGRVERRGGMAPQTRAQLERLATEATQKAWLAEADGLAAGMAGLRAIPELVAAMPGEKARFMEGALTQAYRRRMLYEDDARQMEDAAQKAAWLAEAKNLAQTLNGVREIPDLLAAMPAEKAEFMERAIGQEFRQREIYEADERQTRDAASIGLMLQGTSGDNERLLALYGMADDLPAGPRRDEFLRLGQNMIRFEAEQRAFRGISEAEAFFEANKGRPMYELLQEVGKAGLSPEGEAEVRAQLGPSARVTAENASALNDGLYLVDAGALATEAERIRFAVDNNLTVAQRRRLLEYAGNLAEVSLSRVNQAYRNLGMGERVPLELYDQLLPYLKKGSRIYDTDIQNAMAALLTSNGRWLWNRENLLEAAGSGRLDDWLPEVSESERQTLMRLLAQQGIQPTARNIQLLKKLNLLKSVNIDPGSPEWE